MKIYYLDEKNSRWIPINSEIDEKENTVSCDIKHFSIYTLMGARNYEVDASFAYPVPYKPSERPAVFENTNRAGITFTNLPSECSIEIYTITGRLVNTLTHSDALLSGSSQPGNFYWYPVINSYGDEVASGVYIYYITSGNKFKMNKLMIIK